MIRVRLEEVCNKASSNYAQKDLDSLCGDFPVYGASGLIKCIDTYHQNEEYIAVVKDGAGIGRTMFLPAKSSVIGTLQYILPKDNVLPKYLYYAVKHMHLEKYYTGATIPHIYFKDYKKEEFNLPSRELQLEIIDILDKVEGIIGYQKQQLEKLDTSVKSRFVEMFGDPTTNPNKCSMYRLSEIAEYFNGLTYKPENVSEAGTIVLRSSNIQNSQLDFADIVRVNCPIRDRMFVRDNDILMCSRNGSAKLVGKVALIKSINEPMSFGAFMMIIRSQYYPYLMTYFQMDAFRRQIRTGATTTINQITGAMLDKVILPVPDLESVNAFGNFIKQVDKLKVV